jgi:sulfoxide reductase heme-binding subunit YedZ
VLCYDIAGELAAPGSRLGADPGNEIVLTLGEWSIRILLLTLVVSTVRRLLNAPRVMRYRRMIGLFAFTYVILHFLAYLGFLAVFDFEVIIEDLAERTYITAGFLALLILVPLAVTSTNGWRRSLGRRWVSLHRLVYVAVGLGLLHLFWLTKDFYGEAVFYLVVFTALMGERLFNRRRSA